MAKFTILIHVVTVINQFQWQHIPAKLFLRIKPLISLSASLTAVGLVRAVSAVLQPIAVLRVVVAGPISARPLRTRWIVCNFFKKEKDFSCKFFLKCKRSHCEMTARLTR